MPIAILHQSYGRFGGAERVALAHYEQLRRMNVDATLFWGGLITPGWKDRLAKYEIRPIPSAAPSFAAIWTIPRFLRELSKFDRLIIHHHVDPVLAFYITKAFPERTVWYSGSMFELAWEHWITGRDYRSISRTVRQTSAEFYGSKTSSIALSKFVFNKTVVLARTVDIHVARRYSRIIANSRFLSRFLKRIYKLGESPGVVYPAPDPILESLSTKYLRETEGDYMLAVGPLIPLKNIDTMIQAASKVPSARLVVAGNGQDREALEDLATQLSVPFHVKGDSHSEDELAQLYSRCKVLVHLSRYEPFGLTPVEAGLFEKPAIVTDHGGPPETVVQDETGFIVDPEDCGAIAKRMTELLANPALRHEMGRKARKRVSEHFTLEKSAKQLMAEVES